MELNKCIKINNRYTLVDLDDEIHFIPSDEVSDDHRVYKAKGTVSIQICRYISSGSTIQEIVELLSDIYDDVDRMLLEKDVVRFVDQLMKAGIVNE